MGRPERPLDPAAGPVQAFAEELRRLRRQAGSPSYRALAARANYSHTVLSDATRGERLPTLAVTLAFVRACDGDPAEWEARWHLHRQRAEGRTGPSPSADMRNDDETAASSEGEGVAADGEGARSKPTPDLVESAKPTDPGRSWGRPSGGLVRQAQVLGLVAVLAGAAGWWLRPDDPPAPAVSGAATASTTSVDDGTDPKVAGCTTDNFPRDHAPVTLDRPARLHGRTLPAGTQVGTVYLFYSARCAGAWTRFAPTPGLNPNPDETSAASVSVQVDRPIDGTSSFWKMGHVDSMYSNMLLVGVGCVTASATVRMTGQDAVGAAHTRCLGRP